MISDSKRLEFQSNFNNHAKEIEEIREKGVEIKYG
jgi:hypothetical protein